MSDVRQHPNLRRPALVGALVLLFLSYTSVAYAQLLPSDFFSAVPAGPAGAAAVEADSLFYDMDAQVIRAQGGVVMRYMGYTAQAQRLVFNQRTGALVAEGGVELTDPEGNTLRADSVDVTGNFQQAVLRSVSVTSKSGATVSAADVNFARELEIVLLEANYSPCGLCVDEKGRRIGWRVRAAKVVLNEQTKTVYLEQPQLELLGVPVAWLPFLWLGDPTDEDAEFQLPRITFSPETGVGISAPIGLPVGETAQLLFIPGFYSRQGFMLGAQFEQRFDMGRASVWGSAINQWDPAAFAGEPGDRPWRGAIQTIGRFTPLENWTAGWSYTAFTDATYFDDYGLPEGEAAEVNEAYASYLTADVYADVRVQQFNALGDDWENEGELPIAYPNGRYDSVTELGDGRGQVSVSARLLALSRDEDDEEIVNGVPYVFGFEGQHVHGMAEIGWQNQLVTTGGVLVTPYLGLRADAAFYDGASGHVDAPPETTLLTATPIAAVDVRLPLVGREAGVTYLVEPIGQLAFRGSSTTETGITNEDAQSFVFEDTNLFSFDRFSGSDRQETGLTATVGAHYLATFDGGGWLDLIAGQSFHLAGLNAFTVSDATLVGTSSGLEDTASYFVMGARGSVLDGLTLGAKAQLDVAGVGVARAGLGANFDGNDYALGIDYFYLASDPALGLIQPQHEVAGSARLPVTDYWSLSAKAAWDLGANSWLEAGAGIEYDDDYLLFGVDLTQTGPTHENPNETRVMTSFALKTPDSDTF